MYHVKQARSVLQGEGGKFCGTCSFLPPRSLQTELLAAEEAALRRGVRAGPAPGWRRPLSLPYGIPPAGRVAADVPQRLAARVEQQVAHLPR